MRDYIFVVGFPRSGTTLLSVLLDRHPALCVTPETAFFDEVAPSLACRNDATLTAVLASWSRLGELGLDPAAIRERLPQRWNANDVLAAILDAYAARKRKRRAGEKTPQHLAHVPQILCAFPNARVVCMLRDGRDAALSLNMMPWWNGAGLAAAAMLWKRNVAQMRRFARRHADRFLIVRYEDLVADPTAALGAVMQFLGETVDPAQLDPATASAVVLPRSAAWKGKALGPIDPAAAGARVGAASQQEVSFLDRFLAKELGEWGYATSSS